jgi:hypothetical protein
LNGALTLNRASATLSSAVHVTFPGGSDGKAANRQRAHRHYGVSQPTAVADSHGGLAALFPGLAVNVAVTDDNLNDNLPDLSVRSIRQQDARHSMAGRQPHLLAAF